MGIFKAPKAGSQSGELMVGGLTGVMDLKIFYRGKNRGEGAGRLPGGGVSAAARLALARLLSLPPGHNACIDWPCSLLCLPRPGHQHTCVCPDGAPTASAPDSEPQCRCPSGYQLQNKTCIKTGETAAGSRRGPGRTAPA